MKNICYLTVKCVMIHTKEIVIKMCGIVRGKEWPQTTKKIKVYRVRARSHRLPFSPSVSSPLAMLRFTGQGLALFPQFHPVEFPFNIFLFGRNEGRGIRLRRG